MRPIKRLVIHCSASPNSDTLFRGSPGTPGGQTPVQAIDAWHAKRGFKRGVAACRKLNPGLPHIGYHYVIYRNGVVATGRHPDEVGAHVKGGNLTSIGICLVGIDQFTPAQWAALAKLVGDLQTLWPMTVVVGHRDLSPDTNGNGRIEKFEWLKTCPGFDVGAWLFGNKAPLAGHIWTGPAQ